MGTDTEYAHGEWIDHREPWEYIEDEWRDEPTDLVRNARVQAVRLLNAFGSSLESVLTRPNATLRDVTLRFYGLAFGLGLTLCDGRSMTEIAEGLGFERASVSKIACEFCRANNLVQSFYMKSALAPAAYQSARIASIEKANGKLPRVPPRGRRV